MGAKYTLPSGIAFEVTPLPYEDAWGVTQSFFAVVEKLNIDLQGLDLSALSSVDVLKFKGPICSVLASNDCLKAAKTCFSRCLYNNLKIDASTFESKQARGDFLFACFYALKENIAPFFETALSFFGTP